MPVLVAEMPRFRKKKEKKTKQNMALWISYGRFFLLQVKKAIYIHLISEALVIGGY